MGEQHLDLLAIAPRLEAEWGKRYPAIGQAWRWAWEHVIPFFAFAPGIRKMIYTTNAVEALHRSLRKIIKTRGSFPNDDAALKLLYLAIKNAGLRWRRGIEWTAAMGQFAIAFGSRFPGSPRTPRRRAQIRAGRSRDRGTAHCAPARTLNDLERCPRCQAHRTSDRQG
jgi:hypothetical protein